MMEHVYEIADGGEIYWWAAKNPIDAEQSYRDYMASCGVSENEIDDDLHAVPCPDEKMLTIDGKAKTCGEWAKELIGFKVPMVGTTAI